MRNITRLGKLYGPNTHRFVEIWEEELKHTRVKKASKAKSKRKIKRRKNYGKTFKRS